MSNESKHFHEFGYADERFLTVISENLHCAICSCVFKDPKMCKNEHCFCRGCITHHLQNSHTCPSCNEDLTIESLADAPRILRNLLSEQRIRCDHHERGCQEIVQLGNLASHVSVCGKAPVVCTNEECSSEINREDQFRHQGEECRFRKVKCQNCKEMAPMVQNLNQSLGGLVEKVGEIKTGLTAMENRLEGMENACSDQSFSESPKDPRSDDVKDAKHPNGNEYAYFVAGGYGNSSVEIFDKTTNSWKKLQSMSKARHRASSVVYNNEVLVSGGSSNHALTSMVQFKRNINPFVPPCWFNLEVNLPRPLRGHHTLLYKGNLIVLGGYDEDDNEINDLIYEIQLKFPFTTKVLTKFPSSTPIKGCGAVLVNKEILMFGGCTRAGKKAGKEATANVTMYDIFKGEFKELAPLPYKVCNMAAVKCGEKVILVGGASVYPDSKVKATVISYNIETEESTELPPMNEAHCGCCALVDGNSLVVIGGKNGRQLLTSVAHFDFKTSKWSNLPSMIEQRAEFIAEIV
ncbi:uncharacterized protein LOC114526352 [Dendronephthya gigantea]|uniref:uncharacterized protein LOC114526352 n=1 Tax=Dendronephthya gigantea TaxID=151771 RepID=UPI00106B3296|nr:uncharacterized protein LOC114526352 [Dendronephthya gigantea]